MSRSGYTDDNDDPLALGRWRAQVASSLRGVRGQMFLQELAQDMDAMPEKELIRGELIDEDGSCCTIGVVLKARGIDVSNIDMNEPSEVGCNAGISYQMAAEIEHQNDDDVYYGRSETPAERWVRMRKWVDSKLAKQEEE